MQAVFNIGISILGPLIWVCPNLISSNVKVTSKCDISFLIVSVIYELNNEKIENKFTVSS